MAVPPPPLRALADWLLDVPEFGVYFLLDGEEVVYVGQSHCVNARVRQHQSEGAKRFDRAVWLSVPEKLLWDIEDAFISVFRPKYNRTSGALAVDAALILKRHLGVELDPSLYSYSIELRDRNTVRDALIRQLQMPARRRQRSHHRKNSTSQLPLFDRHSLEVSPGQVTGLSLGEIVS